MTSNSASKLRHRMRCYVCRHAGRGSGRFTLKRHPSHYKRPPKCPSCKTENVHSVEKERREEAVRRPSHRCTSYPFPHVPGTLRMCTHNEDYIFSKPPTEEELRQYEQVLHTPRRGTDGGVPDPRLGEEIPF